MIRLKQWRERRGFTLRGLAEQCGVHFVTLARLEAGRLDPRLSTLLKLCEALNITLTELVGEGKTQKGGRK